MYGMITFLTSVNFVKVPFDTVLCLSGCLATYRWEEAITKFVSIWANDNIHYGDDRNLKTYTIATLWSKGQLVPLKTQLLASMIKYDDAKNRGLTTQTIAVEQEII